MLVRTLHILAYCIAIGVIHSPACLGLVPMITIRGGLSVQKLPQPSALNWPIWTFSPETASLERVEDDPTEGWVACTTYNKLFLPSDLPLPTATPAIGAVISNGMLRYIMPSVILTLSTPERRWRNRGLNSLPRSASWIDTFSQFNPAIENLKLSAFGQNSRDVRFLEDQDDAAAWESLYMEDKREGSGNRILSALRPAPPTSLTVAAPLNRLKKYLQEHPESPLFDGYHFVDIPLPEAPLIKIPLHKMRMFLTDIENARGLLEYEGPLDSEPIGELQLDIVPVGAGGSSEFLPEVYRDLYEPGNILVDDI